MSALPNLKKVLNIWSSRRHLTILGRITIIKNLALAKLVYRCSVLSVPVDFVKEVNRNIFSFVWNFKPEKATENHGWTNLQRWSKYGDFFRRGKSLNIGWVNRHCKAPDSHWCALLDFMLHKVGRAFLFQCNYDLKLLELKSLPTFYKNVLQRSGKNLIPGHLGKQVEKLSV